MRSRRLFIGVMAIFAIFLASCTVEYNTVINEDETGVFSIRVLYSQDDLDVVTRAGFLGGDDPEFLCEAWQDDLEMTAEDQELDVEVNQTYLEEEGEFTCELSLSFEDFDQL